MSVPTFGYSSPVGGRSFADTFLRGQPSTFSGGAVPSADDEDLVRTLSQVNALSAQAQQLGLADVEGTGPRGFLTGALDYLSRPQSAVLGLLTGLTGRTQEGEPTGALERAAAALSGEQQFRGGDLFGRAPEGANVVQRLLAAVPGFAVDVATDPLTYLTLGRGGTLRGAGAARATEAQVRRQAMQAIQPPTSQAVTTAVPGLGTSTQAAQERARRGIDVLTDMPVVPLGGGLAQPSIIRRGMTPTEAVAKAPRLQAPTVATRPQVGTEPSFMARRGGQEAFPTQGARARVEPLQTEPMTATDPFVERIAAAAGEGQIIGGARGARDAIRRVLEERYTPEQADSLTRRILAGTTGEVRGGIGVRIPFIGRDAQGGFVPAGEAVTRRAADLTPGAGYLTDDLGLRSMAEATRNVFNQYRSSAFFNNWSKMMNGRFGQEYAAVIRNSMGKGGMTYDDFRKLTSAEDARVQGLRFRDAAAVGVLQTVKQMVDSSANADEVARAAENYYHMGDAMVLAPGATDTERLGFEVASALRMHGENMFDELLSSAERAGVEVGNLRGLADNYVPRPLSAEEIAKRRREGKPVSGYDAQVTRELGFEFDETGRLRNLSSVELNQRIGRKVFETDPIKVAAQQYASYSEFIAKLNLVADLKSTGLLTELTPTTLRQANLRKIDKRLENFRGTVAEMTVTLSRQLDQAQAEGDLVKVQSISKALDTIASSDEAIRSVLSTIDNTDPDELKKVGNLVSVMKGVIATGEKAGAKVRPSKKEKLLRKQNLVTERTVVRGADELVQQGLVPIGAAADVRLPRGMSNMFATESVRDAVDKYFRVESNPSTIRKFFDNVYMPYYTLFKTYATIGRPGGYHARNLMGAWWNNYLGDVSGVDHKLAARVLAQTKTSQDQAQSAVDAVRAGKPSGLSGEEDQLARYIVELSRSRGSDVATYEIDQLANYLLLKKLQGVKVGDSNLADVFTAATDQGLLRTSRALNEIRAELRAEGGELVDSLMDPRYINLFRGTSRQELSNLQATLNKTANWSLLRGSAAASDLSENYVRLAAFISGARRFGIEDGGVAANYLVKGLHFDYQDLSDFERQVMKNIIPFYVWTRRNVPLQFAALLNQPGKFNKLQFAQDELQNQFAADGDTEIMAQIVPEWMRNKMGFVSAISSPIGGAPLVMGLESPAFDLNRYLAFGSPQAVLESTWKEGVSASNPLFKALVEATTGVDTFTGAPFSARGTEPSGVLGLLPEGVQRALPGSFTGPEGEVRVPGVVPNLASDLLPPLGAINRLIGGGDQQERLFTNYLGQFTGLPVSTLTQRQAEAELRTREDRLRTDIDRQINEVAAQLNIDSAWLKDALRQGYTFAELLPIIESGAAPRPVTEG